MKALLNGAEPISVKILNDFVGALSLSGFMPEFLKRAKSIAPKQSVIDLEPNKVLKPKTEQNLQAKPSS